MRVLAFDPGYERLGVAVVEKQHNKEHLVFSDCIRTPASLPFPERLKLLGEATETLIAKWQPNAMALEEIYFDKNAKTAMQVAEVRGMLMYVAVRTGLILHQYTPLEVKVALTGYGKSDKKAVALMVERILGNPPMVLRAGRLDDELDAIAVGITCLATLR